jgi:hypothetical protein
MGGNIGNIGNNSCGIHSVQSQLYGPGPRTSDNVHALEVVTYDGARFWAGNGEEERLDETIAAGGRKGQIHAALRDLRRSDPRPLPVGRRGPRRVSGYNLEELLPEKGFNVARALTGTESTCVTVLRSTLMLTPRCSSGRLSWSVTRNWRTPPSTAWRSSSGGGPSVLKRSTRN